MPSFAIIGYGKMGQLYDKLLDAKYVIDVFPIKNKIYFKSTEEFIAYGPKVDIVIVSTSTHLHHPIAKKLLLAGYDVLVEKPITLSHDKAEELEKIAKKKHLMLYQSTLERYNPLIKFLKHNVSKNEIEYIESFRFNEKSKRSHLESVEFDLGIHDVDLWFYLYNCKVDWKFNVGIGNNKREIIVYLKNKNKIILDLLNKTIHFNGTSLDLSKSSSNNPILEMVYDLIYNKNKMNELWSKEIKFIEDNLI